MGTSLAHFFSRMFTKLDKLPNSLSFLVYNIIVKQPLPILDDLKWVSGDGLCEIVFYFYTISVLFLYFIYSYTSFTFEIREE